jgi:hypothetical protein
MGEAPFLVDLSVGISLSQGWDQRDFGFASVICLAGEKGKQKWDYQLKSILNLAVFISHIHDMNFYKKNQIAWRLVIHSELHCFTHPVPSLRRTNIFAMSVWRAGFTSYSYLSLSQHLLLNFSIVVGLTFTFYIPVLHGSQSRLLKIPRVNRGPQGTTALMLFISQDPIFYLFVFRICASDSFMTTQRCDCFLHFLHSILEFQGFSSS